MIAIAFLAVGATQAHATLVSVYDYVSSLTQPFPAQTGTELWTFHYGDENGSLMPVYSAALYGYGPSVYASFGYPADTGGMSGGSAGANEAPGIFVQTDNTGLVAAVFHVDAAFTAESFLFTYELVGSGNQGNGLDLTLRTVRNSVVDDRGTLTIDNTVSAQQSFDFGPVGLDFEVGDEIVVLFDSRGSYLYDHGWWNVELNELQSQGSSNLTAVPEPSTYGLIGSLALATLVGFRRYRANRPA